MSEVTITTEIYIKEQEKHAELVDILKNSNRVLNIGTENLSIAQYEIDDVIYIETMTGGYDPYEKLFVNWVQGFNPEVAIINIYWDFESKEIGVTGKEIIPYKSALDKIKSISKRVKNGFAMLLSDKKCLAYLKENDVNPLDEFQGVKNIDRLVLQGNFKSIEYFLEHGLDPDHIVTDHRSVEPVKTPLIFSLIYQEGLPTLGKIIEYGADISISNKYGKNLLHKVSRESIEFTKFLIDIGVDIHKEDKHGRTPLMHIIQSLFKFYDPEDPDCEADKDKARNYTEIFLKSGASPYLLDKNNEGLLDYSKKCFKFHEWLKNRIPDLEEVNQ